MAKVYIVQESGSKNFVPAREFGEIQVMLTGRTSDMDDIDECIDALKKQLSKFTSDDFLLLVGDPILMGIATAFASEATDGNFTLLWWDRIHYKYHAIPIDI